MQEELEVEYSHKPIPCILYHTSEKERQPTLIFTHGAGGGLSADATANFCSGFSTVSPVLGFEGNSNLKSRLKMFSAILESQNFSSCLGGRSMGSRAAIMAATEDTKSLILVSYPLQGPNDTRDQILLDLPKGIDVLFIIGDSDSMCDMDQLDALRRIMKCSSWKITVSNANHGMTVRPKEGTSAVGKKTGEIAAKWLSDRRNELQEGTISWDNAEQEAIWSGWQTALSLVDTTTNTAPTNLTKPSPSKPRPSKKAKVRKESDVSSTVPDRKATDQRAERAQRRAKS